MYRSMIYIIILNLADSFGQASYSIMFTWKLTREMMFYLALIFLYSLW